MTTDVIVTTPVILSSADVHALQAGSGQVLQRVAPPQWMRDGLRTLETVFDSELAPGAHEATLEYVAATGDSGTVTVERVRAAVRRMNDAIRSGLA